MNGISVPSRFSCLKIEDEDFHPVCNNNKPSKKKVDNNINTKPAIKKPNANVEKTEVAKKHSNKQIPSSNNTASKTTTKKTKSKAKNETKQWEDWKKKDDELVNENFEQELQSAIVQSKLDFEIQKKNSVSVIITTQDKSKKRKSKTMSLDQFLEGKSKGSNTPNDVVKLVEDEDKFFEKVMSSAKQEIKREKVEEKRRERNSNIEEVISLVHCQEKLKKQMDINEQLREELEKMKKEISLVKKRNKTLCSMLSQGEMKDKAAVLLELEKLTTVKEELTEEVARLHKLLEQERSSTKASSNSTSESHNTKHKEKTKKKKH